MQPRAGRVASPRFRWPATLPLGGHDAAEDEQRLDQPLAVGRVGQIGRAGRRLAGGPHVEAPLGLRDRTMLKLMLASGLRVSELDTLKSVHVSLSDGALRVTGKGAKERLVPFDEEAHAWIKLYLVAARARADSEVAGERCPLRHRARRADGVAGVLDADQGACIARLGRGGTVAAHAATWVRDAPAEPRCGPARGELLLGHADISTTTIYTRFAR